MGERIRGRGGSAPVRVVGQARGERRARIGRRGDRRADAPEDRSDAVAKARARRVEAAAELLPMEIDQFLVQRQEDCVFAHLGAPFCAAWLFVFRRSVAHQEHRSPGRPHPPTSGAESAWTSVHPGVDRRRYAMRSTRDVMRRNRATQPVSSLDERSNQPDPAIHLPPTVCAGPESAVCAPCGASGKGSAGRSPRWLPESAGSGYLADSSRPARGSTPSFALPWGRLANN